MHAIIAEMDVISAVALGVVQGLTEFLPVSSTGHLILAYELFGIEDENALAFVAVLHLSTLAAVIVYFFSDIWQLINAGLRKIGKLPVNERDLVLLQALIIGTIPAVVLGLTLESVMETLLRNPLLVAGALVLGSILFMYAEWRYTKTKQSNEMNVKKGLKIGFFQALALIPGMSRSGSAIAGGMLLGLSRVEATRFSFLLAIPIILGAGVKKMLELMESSETVPWLSISIGAVVAFAVGFIAIHFMLSFVKRHTLWPFIWYRIILAAFILFIVVFG